MKRCHLHAALFRSALRALMQHLSSTCVISVLIRTINSRR